jgi:glycosyltransferase involved in cell wall biosynthesis
MGRAGKQQVKPGILYLINDLQAGGAEMFLKRLGEGLSPHYQPWIGILSPERNNADFRRFFLEGGSWKEIALYQYKESALADWAYWKANAIGKRFGINGVYSFLRQYHERKGWQKWLKQKNIVLISSSSTATDSFVAKHIKSRIDLPWVLTQHSSYNKVAWSRHGSETDFIQHANRVLSKADAILFTAEDNKEIYSHLSLAPTTRIKKVYLGYEPRAEVPTKPIQTPPLKLAMMARGIPEKGWEQALKAVEILNADAIQVEFQAVYSPSEYMEALQGQYAHVQGIHWRAYVPNPASILAESHATLLPSYFQESLPYAVTESLAYGTPVITLPVAEIPMMLKTDLGLAGQLLEAESNGKANIEGLVKAIQMYIDYPEQCREHSMRARLAFAEKFSMQTCLNEYKAVFDALTQPTHS